MLQFQSHFVCHQVESLGNVEVIYLYKINLLISFLLLNSLIVPPNVRSSFFADLITSKGRALQRWN